MLKNWSAFLIILELMKEQEQIQKLQEELDLLKSQLDDQQARIEELQMDIIRLSGGGAAPSYARSNKPTNAWSLENFIGLRLIHFIGIIVLVIGLSIGVKYAIDQNLISQAMRIGLAYSAGIVLYLLSLKLRKNYILFSAILFSGALASLYFTTYGAYVYYNMISSTAAFIIMIVLTGYTVYEANRYNRQEIALLGLVGAYSIPFLISKNSERADLFFLYILLINLGVSYLSVKKLWKGVGRTAELLTWILFIGWSIARYKHVQQNTGLVFMSLFFLIFFAAILAYRFFQKQSLTRNDTWMVLLNNLGLYLGSLFIFGSTFHRDDLATIALALCVFTSVQSILFYSIWKDEPFTTKVLSNLSLILFALFVLFFWRGVTVTLLWLLTSVIVFIFGVRMKSVSARMSAIILMGATLCKLVLFDSLTFTTIQKVISYLVLGVLLLIISFFYQRKLPAPEGEKAPHTPRP